MTRLCASNLRKALAEPPFYAPSSLEMAPIVAESLLQVARVPHAYGFSYSAIGSAPHLLEFEGVEGFDGLMRADGLDPDNGAMAMRRCLFELMERIWCFAAPAEERITRAPRRELGAAALDPAGFSVLSDFEHDRLDDTFVRYTEALPLDWIQCPALISKEEDAEARLVPVCLVYQGYGHRRPEQRFVPVLSTGLAAGTRYDAALLRGLCEVVERDAFMVRWLGRLAPPMIPASAAPFAGTGAEIADALDEDGFTITVHDLTVDVPVPVVLVAVRNDRRDESSARFLGLGCDPTPGVALDKALRESLTMMANWFEFPGGDTIVRTGSASRATPAQEAALDAFLNGPPAPEAFAAGLAEARDATMPGKFLALLETLCDAGLSAWYGDLTPAGADGAGDFVLVRALIPGLQPMLYERDCWRLGNPRLLERLARLSGAAAAASVEALNLELHPFAIEALV